MTDRDLAYHPRGDAVNVAGSPLSTGQSIPRQDGSPAYVADIKSVWKDDRNTGWVYTDEQHRSYYQENRGTETGKGWSVGVAKFIEVGQNAPTGPGPVQELDAGKSLAASLPPGSTVLRGFDNALRPAARDGRSSFGSPVAIGDEIPNGHGGATSVTAINLVVEGTNNTGFVYRGQDGHDYFQRRTDTTTSPSLGAGLGVISGSYSPAQVSGIHRYQTGDILPGERLEPIDRQTPRLDVNGLGYDPKSTFRLRDGMSQSGTVVAVTNDHVVQDAGRGSFAVYDRSSLPQDVALGTSATITNRGGEHTVQPQQQQDRGLGRA